jgi:tripartite ATP-independent transporter DctM subunit
MLIPPSSLAVLLGAIGEISVGRILIAIIVPGLMLATLYAIYIITRCRLQPSIAPAYELPHVPWSEKAVAGVKYILPVGFIIFLVIGLIILGVATPSEASATGAIGMFILAASYRRLNWKIVKKSLATTLHITVMLFIIIVGVKTFSQILAFSGASKALVEFATGLPVPPIVIIFAIQAVLLFLGMFMEILSIMMITVPLFIPVVVTLGFNPVWFAAIYLLNMEMGSTTPPFGLSLFVMKGVAPPDTTMGDIYKAALPFLGLDLIVLVLIMFIPSLALWLPSLIR